MTSPERNESSDEISLGDFFAPLLGYRRLLWRATLGITVLVAVVGAFYLFLQPVRSSTSLEFRPVFKGASLGKYPNELPFSSTDIVDATVLDQVYDKNHVQDFCPREDFRSGFVVEETSAELQVLDLEYQARLADARLSTVDRDRLQEEFRSRRRALPVQYRLTWLRPGPCRTVPSTVISKALGEVLQTWAEDADMKRGVLKLRVAVLTPGIFDFGNISDQSLLIRADLIRAALMRAIANVREVELLPGAELVQIGTDHVSLAEVRARFEDLVQIYLDPLIAEAGRGLGGASVRRVEALLAEASSRQLAAENRAGAYQTALREYSGVTASPSAASTQRPPSSSDVQSLTPQMIDRTLIDHIVELSETNTSFRQELTRSMVVAKVAAVESSSTVDHYKQLLASLHSSEASQAVTAREVESQLASIVTVGREQMRQFAALYDEFSRVSLRSGPSMYRVERPAEVQAVRSFSGGSYMLLVLAVLFVTPFVLAVGALAHHGLREFTRRRSRA